MTKVVVFGTGDIAQLADFYFKSDSDIEVVAFTVDQSFLKESHFEGKPVYPFDTIEKHFPPSEYKMFIALSYAKMNRIRELKYNESKIKGYSLVSYVSSKCTYLSQFACGENCFILEDNTIQPFVKIGNNVTLWSGNHIGHHTYIHDHNFVSSQVVISGHCVIHSNCFIGVNATLHNNIILQKGTLLSAGVIAGENSVENGVYSAPKSTLNKLTSDKVRF